MDRSRAQQRLESYQQRLLDLTDRAERLMTGPPDDACPALARLRWEMLRAMREYQLFKYGSIFAPAIGSPNRRAAAMGAEMKARCVVAGDRYVAFVQQWGAADMAADWDGYRGAMRSLSAAVRSHLVDERAGVRALLALPA